MPIFDASLLTFRVSTDREYLNVQVQNHKFMLIFRSRSHFDLELNSPPRREFLSKNAKHQVLILTVEAFPLQGSRKTACVALLKPLN